MEALEGWGIPATGVTGRLAVEVHGETASEHALPAALERSVSLQAGPASVYAPPRETPSGFTVYGRPHKTL